MRSTVILAGVLMAGLAAILWLHHHNGVLRDAISELAAKPGKHRQVNVSKDDGARGGLPAPEHPAAEESSGEDKSEIGTLRARIAALEDEAVRTYAAHATELNRNPELGMTRLEFFRNVGQSTPAAAVQTLVWAAATGDERALEQVISIDERGRVRANDFLSRLSEAQRAQWPTPESLMALAVCEGLLKVSAIQIVQTTLDAQGNSTVAVRGVSGTDQNVRLRQGTSGWQVHYTDKQVDWAINHLSKAQP